MPRPRMPEGKRYHRMSLAFSSNMYKWLDEQSFQQNLSMSQVVRNAIADAMHGRHDESQIHRPSKLRR